MLLRQLILILILSQTLLAQEWLEITPQEAPLPPPRTNAGLIFDSQNHRMILFGGRTENRVDLNDVWAFDLVSNRWAGLTPSQDDVPLSRRTPNCVYNPDDHSMIMWSGQSGSTTLNDVWKFDLSAGLWTELRPNDPKPNRRYGAASIFDPVAQELVTFAGFTSAGRFNDSWRFRPEDNSWVEVTPDENLPQMRCLHSASYDATGHRMIVYGGQRSGALEDIWAFDLTQNSWSELTPAQGPPGRWFTTNVYDSNNQRIMIFGGNLNGGKSDEVWVFDLSDQQWSQRDPSGEGPVARDGAAAVFVPEEDRMIVFGGRDASGAYLRDVWSLNGQNAVSVDSPQSDELPTDFRLIGNFPNPFNPVTQIVFESVHSGHVRVTVHNLKGQLITSLLDRELPPGRHHIRWDGTNAVGTPVTSGLYFYRVRSGSSTAAGRMILTK